MTRYLIAADDKSQPGCTVCTFATFETEVITPDQYDAKRSDFIALQPDMPEAAMLRRLMGTS